jgi:uncharacterized protein (TIGR00369 family)
VNTDRVLVLQFLQGSRKPAAITSNPLAHDLCGELLELDTERGAAVLAFVPPPRFLQGAQMLQGGIIAALLDFAMAFAAHALHSGAERPFSTATLNLSLLRPATPGRYLAHGHIVRSGRRLMFANAELRGDAGGATVATASAVMPFTDT